MTLQIAIDGPVAAGKGTVSKLLAEKLHILYVDTGAMYRALTYFVKQHHLTYLDELAICKLINTKHPQIHLQTPNKEQKDGRLVTVYLDNKDISWAIRTEDISYGVSVITQYKCVREYMVPQQQMLADKVDVIMEGRDITTKVLPNSDLRIYMDANEVARAKRRYEQYLEKGQLVEYKEVLQNLQERDYRDMHRDIDPLKISKGVWYLDTSKIDISEVVDKIHQRLLALKLI